MMVILTLLYILSGFLFIVLIAGFINEYFNGKKKEQEHDVEIMLCEVALKDAVQGIKKRSVKKVSKPKVTTDMIKDKSGKTKVVKRDKKGHFVK